MTRRPVQDRSTAWHGFHAFYHGGLDLLLDGWARPLLASLYGDRRIDGFFFIRYHLGGPHVRLRLRCPRSEAGRVADTVRAEAARFFHRHPSEDTLDAAEIRRRNRTIIPGDPHADESDDRVFPDGSVAPFPVRFEVERYGGRELLDDSLEMFALSSAAALATLPRFADRGKGSRLTTACRVLTTQAWGHAGDGDELLDLLDYARRFMGHRLGSMVDEGDRAYDADGGALRSLVRETLLDCASPGRIPAVPPWLATGARRLTAALSPLPGAERRHVLDSQLHMTVIRLGLDNPHEVYLLRMLRRAAADWAAAEPEAWRRVWRARGEAPRPATWPDLRVAAVADLAPAPAAAAPPAPRSAAHG